MSDTSDLRPDPSPDDEPELPEIIVGTEPEPPGWRTRRGIRNRLRHLCCATRTGAKIDRYADEPLVIETA